MKKQLFVLLISLYSYNLYGQGTISFSTEKWFTANQYSSPVLGYKYHYNNIEELKKILVNAADTMQQIVIVDDNIKTLPKEFYKFENIKWVQIISSSITSIDKGFIKMDSLEKIECNLDSIGEISSKLYKSKKLRAIVIDVDYNYDNSVDTITLLPLKNNKVSYNPKLRKDLELLVKKFDRRKKYFIIVAGGLYFETKTEDTW